MLTGTPVFTSKVTHCPVNPSEDKQGTGRLCIWAYLKISGNVLSGLTVGAGGSLAPQYTAKSANILPQMAVIPFSVDFGTSVTQDVVHKAGVPVGSWSPASSQPIEYVDDYMAVIGSLKVTFSRPSLPVINPFDERKPCLDGKVSFLWQSSRFPISSAGGGSLTTPSPIPLGSPISLGGAGSGVVGVGGTPYAIDVGFTICYKEGCQVTINPSPDTCTDGDSVYASGGNP
jgi:hypothetical protein